MTGRLTPLYYRNLKAAKIESNFPMLKLGSFTRMFSGGTPSKANTAFWEGPIGWLSPKDIKQFFISEAADKVSQAAIAESATQIAPAGAVVLVARSGILAHTLPVAVLQKPLAINQDLKAIVVQKENVLPDYLGSYLSVLGDRVLPLITKHGSTVQSIETSELRYLKIPIPSLERQLIVSRLFSEALAKKQQQEQAAQSLLAGLDAYLLRELGIDLPPSEVPEKVFYSSWQQLRRQRWDAFFNQPQFDGFEQAVREGRYPTDKLRAQCASYRGVVYSQEDETDEGHIILRGNNIDLATNELDLTDLRHINAALSLPASQQLYAGDILMSAASGSKDHVGKVAYIEENTRMYFGGFMMCLRTQPTLNSRFLFEFLQSNLFRKVLFRLLGGTSINNLNFSMIASVPVPIPPMEVQERISFHMQQVRHQSRQQRQKAALDFAAAKDEIEKLILS